MKRGKTTESASSLRSMVVEIPVSLVTLRNNNTVMYSMYCMLALCVPADGMRRDVFTRLEKVGVLSGTGDRTTLAAISVR